MTRLRAYAALVLCLYYSQAFACVEGYTTFLGTFVKNGCGYVVNLSWCFGNSCTPGGLVRLNPNFEFKLSDRQYKELRVWSCRAPARPINDQCI